MKLTQNDNQLLGIRYCSGHLSSDAARCKREMSGFGAAGCLRAGCPLCCSVV